MTSVIVLGLLFGAAGSGHCAAMCGPWMAVAAPRGARLVLYHGGRITVYIAIGVLAGVTSGAAIAAGLGRWLALAAAAALVTQALTYWRGLRTTAWSRPITRVISSAIGRAGRASQRHPRTFPVAAGALNGLLPCGLVYAAATAALGAGTVSEGAAFMGSFGVGTAPVAALAGAGLAAATDRLRARVNRWTPVLLILVATLLVARALLPAAAHGH